MEVDNNPASKHYWEVFYSEGKGRNEYEWYNVIFEDIREILLQYVNTGQNILQIGVGNSTILEQLLEDALCPQLVVHNIDISEVAVQQMVQRQHVKQHAAVKQAKAGCARIG
eukprot:TRINITY_DN3014_c0_g1_i2.p4 TRINITY_DN3014_c0_g1~~TRINITY_DN3014_c0_g1_i2.p4  ORF type:complete len:112 (+),score=9.95 TRINITY_DN3014_c0_g1_i2:246-581(+)